MTSRPSNTFQFHSLQETAPQRAEKTPPSRPLRRCAFAPLTRAVARLLQSLLSFVFEQFGEPISMAPADVYRAFHRGGTLVVARRNTQKKWSIECIF